MLIFFFFFFNDTATTEIYTLSLHDALPISYARFGRFCGTATHCCWAQTWRKALRSNCWLTMIPRVLPRSEEHTSELQSQSNLVCRLLLEKKKKKQRLSKL